MGGATRLFSGLRFRLLAFQSTLPVGGATPRRSLSVEAPDNFNPRSPWGERLHPESAFSADSAGISIHAPRGGSDSFHAILSKRILISIHAPRGGSDTIQRTICHFRTISIHAPRGGSDPHVRVKRGDGADFNPRSPWGERQWDRFLYRCFRGFQSTLPVGGATQLNQQARKQLRISIHAPRGGSDAPVRHGRWLFVAISIHAPRGGSDI